jgi:hypothetical protein
MYYCGNIVNLCGPFDFISISEDKATAREWKALNEAKFLLQRKLDIRVAQSRDVIKTRACRFGLAALPTEAELQIDIELPAIKFVALFINGIRC